MSSFLESHYPLFMPLFSTSTSRFCLFVRISMLSIMAVLPDHFISMIENLYIYKVVIRFLAQLFRTAFRRVLLIYSMRRMDKQQQLFIQISISCVPRPLDGIWNCLIIHIVKLFLRNVLCFVFQLNLSVYTCHFYLNSLVLISTLSNNGFQILLEQG